LRRIAFVCHCLNRRGFRLLGVWMATITARGALACARHRFSRSRVSAVAILVLAMVVGSTVIAASVAADAAAHTAASNRYREAVERVASLDGELAGALVDFDEARSALAGIGGTVDKLRSNAVGLLSAQELALLDGSHGRIVGALAVTPGEAGGPAEARASDGDPTSVLSAAARTLERQARRESGWLDATHDATLVQRVEHDSAAAVMVELVTGGAADGDRPAVEPLATAMSALLDAHPRAEEGPRQALVVSAETARTAASAGASVEVELLDVVSRADAVRHSQEAVDRAAAEAAARAAEEASRTTQQRPSDDSSGSGPSRTVHPPGGATPLPPPHFSLVSHTPNVFANGMYEPGCGGVPSETIQAANHGYQLMSLDYDHGYDYRTFVTEDGWGVTVFDCTNPG